MKFFDSKNVHRCQSYLNLSITHPTSQPRLGNQPFHTAELRAVTPRRGLCLRRGPGARRPPQRAPAPPQLENGAAVYGAPFNGTPFNGALYYVCAPFNGALF